MARPEYLNVPPVEAIEHFRSKRNHVAFDWRDTDAAYHLRSFTVAKAMRLDILGDIRGAVDSAISEGITFEMFRERLEPTLRKKGWWGRQEMIDPITNQRRLVQLGSRRRLRIIFDTNIRMATARGRWQRFERTQRFLPYLRYVAVLDARSRPEHMAWHDTVLPINHPFWRTHAPPNGWNCRCILTALSERDLERYNLKVSPDPVVSTRPWTNKRTGEIVQVPRGIDPGFQHNVGTLDVVNEAQDVLARKTAAAAPDIAKAAKVMELDDYIVEGRVLRKRLVAQAGSVDGPGFADAFRRGMRKRLRDERGAGTVDADIDAGAGGGRTATRVRRATEELPASWVRQGNTVPLSGVRASARGRYAPPWRGGPAEISVAKDIGNPLHEYFHHLQEAMPGLNQLFVELHRRRTAGEARVPVTAGSSRELGRTDQYFRPYMGREYGPDEDPLEVLTMAMQGVFHPIWGRDYLPAIVRDDPEMVDLVLGVLFRYNP